MIGKRVESDFPPGFSIEGRDFIQGKHVTLGGFAAVEVQQDYRLSVAPWRQVRIFLGRAAQLKGSIGCELHSLGREQSRGLMISVASGHASAAINHTGGAASTDHADHLFEDSAA